MRLGGLGSAKAPPAGPGGARPPIVFCGISGIILHLFECLNDEELVDLSIEDLTKDNEMHFLILNLKLSNSSAFCVLFLQFSYLLYKQKTLLCRQRWAWTPRPLDPPDRHCTLQLRWANLRG